MLSIVNSLASLSASLLDIIRSGLKLSLPFISSQQLGEELVPNGDFSDGSNNWTFAGGSDLVNGAARINNTATGGNSYIQTGEAVATPGKTYKLKYDVTITNTKPLVIEADSSSDNGVVVLTVVSSKEN